MQTIVDYWRHARLVGLMLALAILPAAAQNQSIQLSPGMAKVLMVDRHVATVILGDTGKDQDSIADVTTLEGGMIIVSAKKAGATNLILLDSDRKEVFNAPIIVSGGAKEYDGTRSPRPNER
jgi:Flp pilus assembly secretin CpaC